MPRTSYRFRVAPVLILENGALEQGEWSEITNISTKDNQTFDLTNHWGSPSLAVSNVLVGKKKKVKKNSLIFEKAGTLVSSYGYCFGEHLWELKIWYSPSSSQAN
jgi:hypothetical protein